MNEIDAFQLYEGHNIDSLPPHISRRLPVNFSKCELGKVVRADPVSEIQPKHDVSSPLRLRQEVARPWTVLPGS